MPKTTTLFLETTTVPAAKSISEITAELVKAGASEVSQSYENGVPSGVRWAMSLYGRVVLFELPVKVDSVRKVLQRKRRAGAVDIEYARRIAWRQLLMWVKVQMAMIQLEQVEFAQVFLPYMMDESGRTTAWDAARAQRFKSIEAPKPS